MKLLIKSGLILVAIFASTFLLVKLTGILSVDDIKAGFQSLSSQPDYFIGGLVILLLFADLFIAVPTMTVIILAGYFLGFQTALIFAFLGLACAALTGYFISLYWGERLLHIIDRDKKQRMQMQTLFHKHGVLMLILCRAMPILPEVSVCLAGASKMPFARFLLGWSLGSIPYLIIVTYAASISNLENPQPIILTAIGLVSTLWLAWAWFLRVKVRTAN